jgi:hypothetical protein
MTSRGGSGGTGLLPRYEIRVAGRLDTLWGEWFEGLTLSPGEDGSTVLVGPVADQAALHGFLAQVRDLGLPLLSVNRLGSDG